MKLISIGKVFATVSVFSAAKAAGGVIDGYETGLMGFSGTIGNISLVANGTAQVRSGSSSC